MARFIITIFALVCLSVTMPAYAQGGSQGSTTLDPNHDGYTRDGSDEMVPVKWGNIGSRCSPCDGLVDAYNQTMNSLLYTRYWINSVSEEAHEQNISDAFQRNIEALSNGKSSSAGQGLDAEMEKYAAAKLNHREALNELRARLREMRAQETRLEEMAKDLLDQIRDCEERMCRGPEGPGGDDYIGTAGTGAVLPFTWGGPYESPCMKCDKLADRLNELPALARDAMAKLEAAKAEKLFAELHLQEVQARHHAIVLDNLSGKPGELDKRQAEYDREAARDIKKEQEALEKANSDIRALESDLDAIKKNFEDTLALYNDCIKDCDQRTGMADPDKKAQLAGGCFYIPGTETMIQIGPNSQYGTGAALKEKGKDMAMGALGSVLGGLGGGMKLGGGGGGMQQIDPPIGREATGGGGGKSGPDVVKDPLGGDYFRTTNSGFDLGLRAGFTDNGLLVSQKIFDSPGNNSTFHATWLEDGKGRKLLPTRYYIYSLYVDHKLTVWWTYDHWTDGVHDAHDEGRETTEWRTNLGDFKVRFAGDEGVKNSIWYQSGFETAVKGVRQIGAEYPVAPGDLTGCGLTSVTHLTQPKNDPVTTLPFLNRLFVDKAEDQKKRNLIVHIKPAIMNANGAE